MDNNQNWVEREVRYRVTADISLPATIRRTSLPEDAPLRADLLDISRSGLKLKVPVELAFQEHIQVHVENDELGLNLTEPARLRWIRESSDGVSWIIGCDIEELIQEDVLEELVERGLLDRRYSRRRPVTGEALAQWELSEDKVPVQLLNLSPDGFCLASDEPTKVGARLKLTLVDDDGQSPYEILARAQWQHEFENGFLIGCDLAMDDVFDLVGYFAASTQKQPDHKGQPRKWSLLAAVALLAALATFYYVSSVIL